jgi:hypothetical protein
MYEAADYADEPVRAGAVGYLLKGSGRSEMLDASGDRLRRN